MPKVATRVELDALLAALTGPRPDPGDAERRVLDAAGALVVAEGLEDFEVDRVAADSGVGRSTIYRHFGDRNTLIAAALAHEARRFLAALGAAVADAGRPPSAEPPDGVQPPGEAEPPEEPGPPDQAVEEQVVAAFCAGLRLARATGLDTRLREDPLLLRLLTVDAGPVVAAARDQLVRLALSRDSPDPASPPSDPPFDPASDRSAGAGAAVADAEAVAELLVRLAISFVVTPGTVLDLDGDGAEAAVRRHVAPLLRPGSTAPPP